MSPITLSTSVFVLGRVMRSTHRLRQPTSLGILSLVSAPCRLFRAQGAPCTEFFFPFRQVFMETFLKWAAVQLTITIALVCHCTMYRFFTSTHSHHFVLSKVIFHYLRVLCRKPSILDWQMFLQVHLIWVKRCSVLPVGPVLNSSLYVMSQTLDSMGLPQTLRIGFTAASFYTVGKTDFRIICADNGGTENNGINTFSSPVFLNITLVNLPPYFNIMNNSIKVSQDSPTVSFPSFVYNISAGQPAEFADTFEFSIWSDNPSVFDPPLSNIIYSLSRSVGSNSATLNVRPAANLFGNATVTISLIETELKSHQLGNQILLSTQASFRIFVFPTRPFPEFNISNSSIQLLEDFGDLNFLQFVTSKYLGGGESNAEQPAFFRI